MQNYKMCDKKEHTIPIIKISGVVVGASLWLLSFLMVFVTSTRLSAAVGFAQAQCQTYTISILNPEGDSFSFKNCTEYNENFLNRSITFKDENGQLRKMFTSGSTVQVTLNPIESNKSAPFLNAKTELERFETKGRIIYTTIATVGLFLALFCGLALFVKIKN